MRFSEDSISRKRWCVITCLFLAFRISVGGATPSKCNDFGLRNIMNDEGDWLFYKFTDKPCLMCLDGRRMSSFNAVLILPCRHQNQPTGSKVTVNYRVRINQTGPTLQALDTNEQCETENGSAAELTGEPVMLAERLFSGGGIQLVFHSLMVDQNRYLLKPSIDVPEQSLICIERVKYENVRLANDTIIGATPTTTPTNATTSTASSTSPDSMIQTYFSSSAKFNEDTNSREERTFTTIGMTSEESADSDPEAQEGGTFPIWWALLILTVIIVGLVALVLFGICRRKRLKRTTNPNSKEKGNMFTKGIAFQSEENGDMGSSDEGTIYNPVYEKNETKDDAEKTANGLQSFAADVDYREMKKQESTNGEMIYNSAYDGLAVKGEDALPGNAAYVTISEINSKKGSSYNRSHETEHSSQEVAENKNINSSKKSTPKKNMVVYEAVDETETENKDRESKVEMIYNSAYAGIPSNEKGDEKRDRDYSVVEGINSGEGSLYSTIDEKGKQSRKNLEVNDEKASSEEVPLYGKVDKTKERG